MPVVMMDQSTEARSLSQMTTEKYSEISVVDPTLIKKSPTDTGFSAQLKEYQAPQARSQLDSAAAEAASTKRYSPAFNEVMARAAQVERAAKQVMEELARLLDAFTPEVKTHKVRTDGGGNIPYMKCYRPVTTDTPTGGGLATIAQKAMVDQSHIQTGG